MTTAPQPKQSPLDTILSRLETWSRRGGSQAEIRIDEQLSILEESEITAREAMPIIKRLELILPHMRVRKEHLQLVIDKLRAGLV